MVFEDKLSIELNVSVLAHPAMIGQQEEAGRWQESTYLILAQWILLCGYSSDVNFKCKTLDGYAELLACV